MKIITVAVKKGGVGKTTIATTLGAGLAGRGYRVLIVDLDPQGHAGTVLGVPPQDGIWDALANASPHATPTGRTGLDILTSGQRTAWINSFAPTQHHISALRVAIQSTGVYDFVVIDTPPTPSWLVDAAIYAADTVVAPIQLTTLASLSGQEFGAYVAAVRTAHNQPMPQIVFVPTFRDDLTQVSFATLADLRRVQNGSVTTAIHRAAVVEKLAGAQETLYEYRPRSTHDRAAINRAQKEYADLLNRIDA